MGSEIQLTYASVGRQANMSPQISLPDLNIQVPELKIPDMHFNPAFSPTFSPVFSPQIPELNPHFHVKVEPIPPHYDIHVSPQAAVVTVTNTLPLKGMAIILFANTLIFASLSYLIHWLKI